MNHIISAAGNNIGSIVSMKLAAIDWLNNLPEENHLQSVVTTEVTTKAGRNWLTLKPESESSGVKMVQKEGVNGILQELELTCTVNLIEETSLTTLNALTDYKLAVIFNDANGIQYIIGTQYEGAGLLYDLAIDEVPEGKTFYNLSLKYAAQRAFCIYNPS